jgi:hypothetical protein
MKPLCKKRENKKTNLKGRIVYFGSQFQRFQPTILDSVDSVPIMG